MVDNWDYRFLRIAEEVSSWSKDPSSKIGAVAVLNRRILSTGYNGFPKGIEDSDERLNDREVKYRYIVHAEMNAIYNATKNGISLHSSTMYVYGLPMCSECAKAIASVGIHRVVTTFSAESSERWMKSGMTTVDILEEAGIIVDHIPFDYL